MNFLHSKVLILIFCFLISKNAFAQFFRPVGSTPENGAKDVPIETTIQIHFNYSVSNISVSREILYEGVTGRLVPTSINFSNDDTTLTIVPRESLKPGTYYIINLQGLKATNSYLIDPWYNKITFTTKGGSLSVITFVSPSELTIPPGGFQDVTYNFIENGGGMAEIMQETLLYESSDGNLLSKNVEKIQIIIRNNQTTRYRASIAIPKELGIPMIGKVIMVRRIFEGLDHDGNRVQFKTGVKVNVTNPSISSLKILNLEILFPHFGTMVPVGSILPASARIRCEGRGEIHGFWNLDGEPRVFFVERAKNGEELQIYASEKAFAEEEGKHRLGIQIIYPEKRKTDEIIYIVCESPSPVPLILMPEDGSVFSGNVVIPPIFRWSSCPSAVAYKIAIGKNKNFRESDWIKTETNSWNPDFKTWNALGEGKFYWAVKPLFYGDKEGPISEIYSFTIKN